MPIIVDPSIPNVPTPVEVESPDGVLTGTVREQGVLLWADFRAVAGVPDPLDAVRFERMMSDGSWAPVRSGDPAIALDRRARAFDLENPLGAVGHWRAVAVHQGVDIVTSGEIALTFDDLPYGPINCRVIPVDVGGGEPMDLIATQPLPTFSRAARVTAENVQGTAYPATSWDIPSARSTTLTFLTQTTEEHERIEALFTSGVVLVMFPLRFNIRPMYAIPEDLSMVSQALADNNAFNWSVNLTEVDRTSTADTPLIIPGWSYQDTHEKAGTYTIRKAMWPNYEDVGGSA